MKRCKLCNETFEGADCFRCVTEDSIRVPDSIASSQFEYRRGSDDPESPLVFLDCLRSGQRLPVSIPMCKFGRDADCDICVEDISSVSRVHFLIAFEEGYFYIMDLGSTNGTQVDGKTLTERTLLANGSRIQAGALDFHFVVNAVSDIDGGGYNSLITYLDSHTGETPIPTEGELRKTVPFRLSEADLAALDDMPAADSPPASEEKVSAITQILDTIQGASEGANADLQNSRQLSLEEPDFDAQYMEVDLARLEEELEELTEAVRAAEMRRFNCESRISDIRCVRKGLLTETDDELILACAKAFTRLGWEVQPSSSGDKQELLLSCERETSILARIVWTEPQDAHQDLAKLVISKAMHWCHHENEPKGLLILSPRFDGKPILATERSFSEKLHEYALQNRVCLATTTQILCLFKERVLSNVAPADLRCNLLDNNGRLPGFQLESKTPVVA